MLYELAKDADLTFLRGRELIQVAIGIYQVVFRFDQNVTISVEDSFEFTAEAKTQRWVQGASHVAGVCGRPARTNCGEGRSKRKFASRP